MDKAQCTASMYHDTHDTHDKRNKGNSVNIDINSGQQNNTHIIINKLLSIVPYRDTQTLQMVLFVIIPKSLSVFLLLYLTPFLGIRIFYTLPLQNDGSDDADILRKIFLLL